MRRALQILRISRAVIKADLNSASVLDISIVWCRALLKQTFDAGRLITHSHTAVCVSSRFWSFYSSGEGRHVQLTKIFFFLNIFLKLQVQKFIYST